MRVGLSATLIKHDKGMLLLHFQPPENTKEPQKERQRQKNIKLPSSYKWFSLLFISLFFPSYLCELLAAAEFLSEGVELCHDYLIGPSQVSG